MILFTLLGIAVAATLFGLVKFLYYYMNDWNFLKTCKKAKGTILRWVPTSSSSQSYKLSWWSSASDWSPVIEYYDYDAGAVQQHEAILPRSCKLNQHDNHKGVEIEYKGRTIRVSDKRFVSEGSYSGSMYALLAIISFAMCILCIILILL